MNRKIEFEKAANRISAITANLATIGFVATAICIPIFLNQNFNLLATIMLSIASIPIVGTIVFMLIGFIGFSIEKFLENKILKHR